MLERLKRLPIILMALGVASIIRVVNANFGYPTLYVVSDEVFIYLDALEMLAQKNLHSFSTYPPLGSYILLPFLAVAYAFWRLTGTFNSLDQFKFYLLTHEGALLFVPRLISALFGIGTLIVTYKLGRLLFPRHRAPALWATALLTFSITHIQFSHLAKPLMESLLFSWLGLYYLVKSITHIKREVRWLIISIIYITIASGFYFLSLIYIGAFMLIRFLYRHRRLSDYRNLVSIAALVIPVIGMWLYFQVKVDAYVPYHLEALRIWQRYQTIGIFTGLKWYLKEIWLTEPWLTGWFLVSLLWWPKLPRSLRLLIPVLIANFLIVSFVFLQSPRYLLPTSIIAALVGGFGISQFIRLVSKPILAKSITVIIAVLLLTPPTIWLDRYLATPTFIQTVDWINHNIPSYQTVAYLNIRYGPFAPGYRSIKLMQTYKPNVYARLSAVLPEGEYPDNVREVIYLDKFMDPASRPAVVDFATMHQIGYLVNSFSHPSQSLTVAVPDKVKRIFLASPFRSGETGQTFDFLHWYGNIREMIKVDRFGPYVEILQIVP